MAGTKRFRAIGRPREREGTRLLVTGSRYWTDSTKIYDVLVAAVEAAGGPDKLIVVQGLARGADQIASVVAAELGCQVEGHEADWGGLGKKAGIIRNQRMMEESWRRGQADGFLLQAGVAFHVDLANSKGTLDMVQRLEAAGIPVLKVA